MNHKTKAPLPIVTIDINHLSRVQGGRLIVGPDGKPIKTSSSDRLKNGTFGE